MTLATIASAPLATSSLEPHAIPAPAPAPIYKALAAAGLLAPFLSHGAVITVGTTAPESATTCSLRDAARAVSFPGSTFGGCAVADGTSNTIQFASNVVGTITYTDAMSGFSGGVEFFTAAPLNIVGPGAATLGVSCSANAVSNGAIIVFANAGVSIGISGISIANCAASGISGGLVSTSYGNAASSLTLSDMVIRNNSAPTGNPSSTGGLLVSNITNVTLNRVSIAGNSGGAIGGAVIFSPVGDVVVRDSTISGNNGPRASAGYFVGNTVSMINTTISGNVVTPSTSSQSFAVAAVGNELAIDHSTIVRNIAGPGANASAHVGLAFGLGFGGGLAKRGDLKALAAPSGISNSIICGNDTLDAAGLGGSVPSSFNLIGAVTPPGAITGVACTGAQLNSWLGPLANNGGPTLTHALLNVAGNPAIGGGDPAFAGQPTDQRGPGFSRVAGGRTDIGAFELAAAVVADSGAPVPATGGAALTGLSVALAALGMRRRQKKTK
jgi:hypothetical protein